MMNKKSFFISLFVFAFFINLISFIFLPLGVPYADGAIILSTNGVAGTQPSSGTKKPFNFKSNNAIADQCNAEPDQYKLTFYKLLTIKEEYNKMDPFLIVA